MNWEIHLLVSLTAIMVVGECLECHTEYDWTMNICEESEYPGGLTLYDFQPLTLTTPLDPAAGCKNYKVGISCSLLVKAKPGQRINVKTGDNYILANQFCSSCSSCDSFTVDGECVKPNLMKNTNVFVSNTSVVLVNFTSHSAAEGHTKAQLTLQAFGCSKYDLTQDENVKMMILDDDSLSLANETYTAKVTCPDGMELSITQQRETTVVCSRTKESDNIFSYSWERNNGHITCSTSTTTIAVVSVVIIIVILAVAVILFVLFCLRKLPCQSERVPRKKPELSEQKEDIESKVVMRSKKEADVQQQAMEEEVPCIHDNKSNNNSNGSHQALITAEVADYWERNGSHD